MSPVETESAAPSEAEVGSVVQQLPSEGAPATGASQRAGVTLAGCGCGAVKGAAAYAIGALGFDFETLERRDALFAANDDTPIVTNADLAQYLDKNPQDARQIIWTLAVD